MFYWYEGVVLSLEAVPADFKQELTLIVLFMSDYSVNYVFISGVCPSLVNLNYAVMGVLNWFSHMRVLRCGFPASENCMVPQFFFGGIPW